ncbi:MAG TPA: hypothetical protein VFA45_01875 [Actinomycetes bacterium]|nr:hypothetical protein [Actinomycetes bacterium]
MQLGGLDAAAAAAYERAVRLSADPAAQAGRLALVDGAAQIADLDPPRAIRMLLNAVHVGWFLGDAALIADTAERLQVVGRGDAEPLAPLVQPWRPSRETRSAAGNWRTRPWPSPPPTPTRRVRSWPTGRLAPPRPSRPRACSAPRKACK